MITSMPLIVAPLGIDKPLKPLYSVSVEVELKKEVFRPSLAKARLAFPVVGATDVGDDIVVAITQ
tara:strand:- start:793 stop:987 length:195 start_codon:yes stop_codon:yes gene_type:complete